MISFKCSKLDQIETSFAAFHPVTLAKVPGSMSKFFAGKHSGEMCGL